MLQVCGWSGWIALFALRGFQYSSFDKPYDNVSLLLVDALAGILLTTGLRHVYRAVWDRSVAAKVVAIILASYIVACVWQPFKNYMQLVIFFPEEKTFQGWYWLFDGLIGYSYFLMLGWSALYFGIKYYQLLQIQIQKSIRAESMAHEAQLRMLRYQLNPHFLFNTLNAISTLILVKNTTGANEMVGKLSNFLRYSLDNDPMQKVSLEHEISTMKLYLEIEQVRFGDRLSVEFDVHEDARKALVPSLILQPLVENSLKYAIAESESGGKIAIRARLFAGDLLLEVEDNGPGMAADGAKHAGSGGVGITNTRERLQELYGSKHAYRFSSAVPHGLKVDIRIPLETADGDT